MSASHLLAITTRNIPAKIQLFSTQQSELTFESDTRFRISAKNVDPALSAICGEHCGLYIVVAGFEESLRINGSLSVNVEIDGSASLAVDIEELYFHCGKSIIRSQLWKTPSDIAVIDKPFGPAEFTDDAVRQHIESAPFLLLATQNDKGDADLSPRGDPGGFVKILDDNTILIPERPGNRIADSLMNILEQPSMAVCLLLPGTDQILMLGGNGRLTTSQSALQGSAVNNKIPKLGIELTVESTFFGLDFTLAAMGLWDKARYGDRSAFPSLGMIISEQLQSAGKIPGGTSLAGRVLGKIMGKAGDVANRHDYKKNLY